jgi:hypothetical protein
MNVIKEKVMLAIKPKIFLKVIIIMMITLESASALLSAGEIDQVSSSFNKNAWEVVHLSEMADYFAPVYQSMCRELKHVLGHDILSRDFSMAIAENPLLGFERLGYCNHYA